MGALADAPASFVAAPLQRVVGLLLLWNLARLAAGAGGLLPVDTDQDFSREAAEIVRGMTESFLAKEVSPQERYCLAGGAGKLAGGVMDTSLETVTSLGNLFGKARTVAHDFGMPVRAGITTPPPWGAPYPAAPAPGMLAEASPLLESTEAAVTTVELARITAIKLASTLTSMFGFEHQLIQSCMTGDSKDAFDKAKANLGNMSFVCGHLVANGVDIVSHLSAALTSFDQHKYRTFGSEIGAAWRKVLLEKGSSSSSLAVHMKDMLQMIEPSKVMKEMGSDAIEEATTGFVDSLFGDDFKVKVTAEARAATTARPLEAGWTPTQPGPNGVMKLTFPQAATAMFGATTEEEMTVDVDLHTCVSGNMELMRQSWEPVVSLAEQFMEGHCTGSVRALCMSLWTVVLTDVQEGLRTCGFKPQQQKILVHSLWAGRLFHANLSVPDDQVRAKDVTSTMARAMEEYKEKDWKKLGENLGELCREMLVVSFPQEWSIDENGRLRDLLQEDMSKPSFGVVFALSAFVTMALAMVVVRRARSAVRNVHQPDVLEQLDGNWDEEDTLE